MVLPLIFLSEDEAYYEEDKKAILQVVAKEERLTELPIIYNVNIGHAKPTLNSVKTKR